MTIPVRAGAFVQPKDVPVRPATAVNVEEELALMAKKLEAVHRELEQAQREKEIRDRQLESLQHDVLAREKKYCTHRVYTSCFVNAEGRCIMPGCGREFGLMVPCDDPNNTLTLEAIKQEAKEKGALFDKMREEKEKKVSAGAQKEQPQPKKSKAGARRERDEDDQP